MSEKEKVSFAKLYSLATAGEKLQMVLGYILAVIAGICPQTSAILWGNVMDSFDPREPDSQAIRTIERQAIYWVIIAVTVFISGYLF